MAAQSFNSEGFTHTQPRLEVVPSGDFDKLEDTSRLKEKPPLYVEDFDSKTAPTTVEGFAIALLRVALSNGSIYKARITEPTDPQTSRERVVGKSAAWWTDIDDPFNKDWSRLLALEGMTVVDTSHEYVLHRDPRKTLRRFLSSSLLNDTYAQLAILKLAKEESLTSNTSDEVIATGLSKSSITSSLMIGRADDYNLHIPYVDGIDPSGEHPWGKNDLRAISRIGSGALAETIELVELAAEYPPHELVEALTHHLFMSPQSTAGHLAATKSLVFSEAGKNFIVPPSESMMHITCFKNCWFNQHEGWMKRLGILDNVHVNPMAGGHLRGGRKEIRRASVERIAKVQDLLTLGIAPKNIDPATQTPRQQFTAAA